MSIIFPEIGLFAVIIYHSFFGNNLIKVYIHVGKLSKIDNFASYSL
jgi:hypothetical protein